MNAFYDLVACFMGVVLFLSVRHIRITRQAREALQSWLEKHRFVAESVRPTEVFSGCGSVREVFLCSLHSYQDYNIIISETDTCPRIDYLMRIRPESIFGSCPVAEILSKKSGDTELGEFGIPLSYKITRNVDALFDPALKPEVHRILQEECGRSLPRYVDENPENYDRVRLAVLKLSKGDFSKLQAAIEASHVDWRDVLLGAGFGNDASAHSSWGV